MKAIKNFDSFKKSLLSATNGNMVESFGSSIVFGGSDYQSYRVYVDEVHYYNMFVIHNFPTNTYDVSLEASNRVVSTMSRVVKTQKAMIESVVAWISCNYLNTKEVSIDSEEFTDICEKSDATEKHYDDYTPEDFINAGIAKECTDCPDFREDCIENVECAKGNDVFDGCKTVKDQYFDTDSVQPNKKIIAKIENIHCCPNSNTCCFVTPYANCDYNYKSDSCIKAYNYFIQDCEQMHKHMKARRNPEWHHVSLATLANIDNDMLDRKRRLYMKVYRMTVNVINTIYKCNRFNSIDNLRENLLQTVRNMAKNGEIEWALVEYVKAKLDNCYLVKGLSSSTMSRIYNYNDSRSYTKTFIF